MSKWSVSKPAIATSAALLRAQKSSQSVDYRPLIRIPHLYVLVWSQHLRTLFRKFTHAAQWYVGWQCARKCTICCAGGDQTLFMRLHYFITHLTMHSMWFEKTICFPLSYFWIWKGFPQMVLRLPLLILSANASTTSRWAFSTLLRRCLSSQVCYCLIHNSYAVD